MTAKERSNRAKALRVKAFLDREYGPVKTFLHYREPWQLLFAVMLSAQATDVSVNKVTPLLFAEYPTLEKLAAADPAKVLAIIRPVGLAPTKSRHVVAAAKMLCTDFAGELPKDRGALMKLPGVGYKTAGVVLGELYGFPFIPVDTHVKTVACKLGFVAKNTTPEKTEAVLEKAFAGFDLMNTHRQLILFGRRVCRPNTPAAHCWQVIESAAANVPETKS